MCGRITPGSRATFRDPDEGSGAGDRRHPPPPAGDPRRRHHRDMAEARVGIGPAGLDTPGGLPREVQAAGSDARRQQPKERLGGDP